MDWVEAAFQVKKNHNFRATTCMADFKYLLKGEDLVDTTSTRVAGTDNSVAVEIWVTIWIKLIQWY